MQYLQSIDQFFMNSCQDTFWQNPLQLFEQKLSDSQSHYSVYEKDGNFVVDMAVPGFSDKDISVSVDKRTFLLKIEANHLKTAEKEEDEGVVWHHQSNMGQQLSLRLPEYVDLSQVDAKCDDGQLTVVFKMLEKETLENDRLVQVPVGETLSKV